MYRALCGAVCFLALCNACLGLLQWTRINPHTVENGTHIEKNATHLSFSGPNGRHAHHPLSEFDTSQSSGDQGSDRKRGSSATGWVSSFWSWGTSYTYLSAQWTVPDAPLSSSGSSIIYIFNSLQGESNGAPGQSGNDIVQPVLQYIGSEWALASWYGITATAAYTHSTPVPVNPGDTITGVVQLSNGVWSVLGYANGVLLTSLTIAQSAFDNGDIQNTAQWVLEVYSLSACTYYPPNNLISLSNIVLQQQGVTITPTWGVPGTNANACNAAGYSASTPSLTAPSTSSSTLTLTWQSTESDLGTPKVVASVGVDISGGDIGTVSASSALACAEACDDNAQCTGWSWDSEGQVTCWLKSTVETRAANPDRVSGVKQGQVNIDRNGAVLEGYPITLPSGATASTCAAYCNSNAACQSWAYNTCGPNQCWLKDAVGTAYAISCRTSGVKGIAFTDRVGGDLSQSVLANGADSAQCANLCASTSGCTNWAYEFPSGPSCSSTNTCWLKTGGLPFPNVNECRAVGNVN